MAAGFVALRDDGVDAARFEPARLGRGRGRTQDQSARGRDPLDQARLRQPEVEAHDLGLGFLHHVAEGSVERRAVARGTGAAGSIPSSR